MIEELETPHGWVKTIIADIGLVVSGGTPSTKTSKYWGDEINWITPSDLTGYTNKHISFGVKSLSREGLKNSSARLIPEGSILFSSRAPIGYVAIASSELCTNQGFKSLLPAGNISSDFIYYYFKFIKHIAERVATGTTFKEISGRAFSSLPVVLPPVNEQHRIVAKIEELFSELDKGIESLKTAREQLKVYRQSLLKHAFEGKLTEQWRKDNADKLETADELLARIQQERADDFNHQLQLWEVAIEVWKASGEVGKKPAKPRGLPTVNVENEGVKIEGLPNSWHCLKLVDFILSLGQGWSPKCNNQPASDGEWGVIKTTAIQHLEYLEKENKQLPGSLYPRPWLELKKDDILITRAGPRNRVGVVCRVIDTREKLLLCDKVYRMRFPQSTVAPAFIESVLNASDFKRKIEELKTGISDSGLNITQPRLLGLYFPIPSLEEQVEIVSILAVKLSVIEVNISYIDINLKKSEALRQSILKKAFSGQLVHQDPNDEPASALLKRIAKEKAELEAAAKVAKTAAKKVATKKPRAKNPVTKQSFIAKKVAANTQSKEHA